MKLEIGQVIYGANYKEKRISFNQSLFVGLVLIKPKIKSMSENFITLEFDKHNTQRISKSN